jgi:hypothetical protein
MKTRHCISVRKHRRIWRPFPSSAIWRWYSSLLVLSFVLLLSHPFQLLADYTLTLGKCTSAVGGGIYGGQFWEKSPAHQGTLIHNYVFDVWADMGFLALGVSIDRNIKKRVRPDFYFDGVIRDIKPLPRGRTKEEVVHKHRDQLRKYAQTIYERNGGAYYPEIEILFYQLDREKKLVRLFSEPYHVDLRDLGIDAEGKTRESLLIRLVDTLGTIGNLKGAVYDKTQQCLMLFGKTSASSAIKDRASILPDDFQVAAHAVYNTEYLGAMVTIDPDPQNLEKRGIVRFGGSIEGTHLGEVMFESDRLLKCLSQGHDNLKDQPLISRVKGFRTLMDLAGDDMPSDNRHEWIRFWFTPEPLEISSAESQAVLLFPEPTLVVKTENVRFDGEELVSDFTPAPSTPQGRFVEHFNQHSDEFAEEFPVLRELRELAKIVALFKWLQDQGIFIDLGYLHHAEVRRRPYPLYVPLIRSTRTRRSDRIEGNTVITETITQTLIGGVDLQNFRFKRVDPGVHQPLIEALRRHPENVPFQYQDALHVRRFFGTASIPNMEIRKVIFESCRELIPEGVREKIRIVTDRYGKVIVYTDATGLTYFFEYDSRHRLSAVHGWDQPISYKCRQEKGNIEFSYEMIPGTGEYIKRFHYRGTTDQVTRIDILKNGLLGHSFAVRVKGEDVSVERISEEEKCR